MIVYGFVGHSGTGKSHHSLEIARRMSVSHILDDGLLIRGNQVLAGTSAKREASRIASIRRALFTEDRHAEQVRAALNESGASSVMILGTSIQMVDAIAKRLSLPPITTYIDIADVVPKSDIETARAVRINEGKHVIPAPTFALKKEFSGYFLAPLRRLVRRGKRTIAAVSGGGDVPAGDAGEQNNAKNAAGNVGNTGAAYGTSGKKSLRRVRDLGERTVVRPTYSYLGGYSISRLALEQLVRCTALKSTGVVSVIDARVDFTDDGLIIEISLCIKYGERIRYVLNDTAKLMRYEMDRQTSLHIRSAKLTAKEIS